jgi:3-keto-5-aminohexanoate cleavage enzyme
MIKTDKLIICVAPCGSFMNKSHNPNIPLQPDEIADEVYRSWNEGASIVHIHARDKEGRATTNPDIFKDISRRIREKGSDIILEYSTSAGREPNARAEDGLRVLEANPEMATIDIGVVIFMQGNEERITLWSRSLNEKMLSAALEKGIKAEFEVYGYGGITEVNVLTEKVPVAKPYWFNFVMDMQRTAEHATPFTPRNLMHYVDSLPPDGMFMTMGVGPTETAAVVQSILLGGHARVGFEDNVYYSRGVMAKSNAELVARVVRIAREMGIKVATPNEAREILGIPSLK